jgi:hypothetical protein
MAGTAKGRPGSEPASFVEVFAVLVLAPAGGAVLFGTAYILLAILYGFVESAMAPIGRPQPSYGQQLMMSWVLITALGASFGLVAAPLRFPESAWVLAMPVLVSVLIAWSGAKLWTDSVNRYGHNASDLIAYLPMLVFPGLVLLGTAGASLSLSSGGRRSAGGAASPPPARVAR